VDFRANQRTARISTLVLKKNSKQGRSLAMLIQSAKLPNKSSTGLHRLGGQKRIRRGNSGD
jgi:hypothetical protein